MTLKLALDARTLPAAVTAAMRAAAKNSEAPGQLTDGRGLYLKLLPEGTAHSWRFNFKSPDTGKRATLTLGDYPDMPLKLAREQADEARRDIAKGVCPAVKRKAAKEGLQVAVKRAERVAQGLAADGTFEAVARDFAASKYTDNLKGKQVNAWSKSHFEKFVRILSLHVFPGIGAKKPRDIKPVMVLACVQAQERIDQMETALCVRRYCQQVFDYCVVLELCEFNPAQSIKAVAKRRGVKGNFASVTTPERAAELMTKIHAHGHDGVRGLLQLMALTYQRPGNVRAMEWAHVDLDAARWTIPSLDMKRTQEAKRKGAAHVVPLSRQAVAILRGLKKTAEADARFVFPNNFRALRLLSPVGKSTAAHVLGRMGFGGDMTAHGFRAMARTMGVQELKLEPMVLEAQLAHSNGNSLGTSYDRATHLPERVKAVQAWADYLDTLRKGHKPATVLKLAA